jgi:cellulose synthase/poly-beta-1,6-N-acetylglucosamine synthase-like glycosyltransferase
MDSGAFLGSRKPSGPPIVDVSVDFFLLAAAIIVGLPGLCAAAHLGLVAVASWFYREPSLPDASALRFLVLIPAHNESQGIGATLAAIFADCRPGDRVLVVADRCTDATAQIARSAGADVLERGEDEPPGRAAARQAGLDHARELDWDVVAMLDADSLIEPGFFQACQAALRPGVPAVQARSESGDGRSMAAQAAVAAFTIQGITLPRGRQRLGLPVRLRGTGMAIRREVALAHSFGAPASEDLFFTLDLLLDGHRCRHVDRARVRSQGASSWGAFGGQKVRYEAGRIAAARAYIPQLLGRGFMHRDAACLEAAWVLAVPPFAPSALSVLLGCLLALAAGAMTVAAVFGIGFLVLVMALVTGLIQARASLRTWLSLVIAPWYLIWKTVVQARAMTSVLRRRDYYGPTARA